MTSRLIPLGLSLLIVRYMAPEQVGAYRQVFLLVSNAVTVLPLGFSLSAYYFLNREPEKRSSAIFHILLFNFAMGGIGFLTLFLFPDLLNRLFQNPSLSLLGPQIGLVIWLWIFSSFLEIAILANQEARLAGVFIIFSQLTKTVLMVAAAVGVATVEAFIYAAIVQAILQTSALFIFLIRRFPHFWECFDWNFFRRQIAYAIPFGFAGLLYTIQSDIHNYFVSYGFGSAGFAVYSIGCFQLPLIAILYESVGVVVIPRMSQLQAEGKKHEMLLMTVKGTQKLSFFYFPLFIFLMITAEEFIITLFTNTYAASVPIFRINLLTLPIFCLMVDPIARAYAEVGRFLLKLRLLLLVTLAGTLWLLIGQIGLIGIISIVVVIFLLEKIATTWKSLQMLEATFKETHLWKNVATTAIAALVSGAGLFAVYPSAKYLLLNPIIDFWRFTLSYTKLEGGAGFFGGCSFLGACLAFYTVVYLLIGYQFGAIEREDIMRFTRSFRNIPLFRR